MTTTDSSELVYPQTLTTGNSLQSPEGRTVLVFHGDGEYNGQLRLYHDEHFIWGPETNGQLGHALEIQPDGSLCIKDAENNQIWTNGMTPDVPHDSPESLRLLVQDHRSVALAVYSNNIPLYDNQADPIVDKSITFINNSSEARFPIAKSPNDNKIMWNSENKMASKELRSYDAFNISRGFGGSVHLGFASVKKENGKEKPDPKNMSVTNRKFAYGQGGASRWIRMKDGNTHAFSNADCSRN